MRKTAMASLLLLVPSFPTMTFAADVQGIVGGVTSPPTRNAMPNDTEEMNDRELRIRRNLENTGTPYGPGEARPNQHLPPRGPTQPNQHVAPKSTPSPKSTSSVGGLR